MVIISEGHPPVAALGEVYFGKRQQDLTEELAAPKVVVPHTQTQCSLLQTTVGYFVLNEGHSAWDTQNTARCTLLAKQVLPPNAQVHTA